MSGLQPILRRPWFSAFGVIGCVLPLLMLWVSSALAGRTRPVSSSFLPSLNQATQQTIVHPSENDEGRPLARKASQATPKKQRVQRGQDYLTQLKELDIPESAKAVRTKLVATLQDQNITCGQTFVDKVRDVCIWEKTRSKSADAPKGDRRGAELRPDVSRQFLRKSHIFFSKLATAGTSAKKQAINTSCLMGLLPKSKLAIKRFLNFQDDDLKELAESGSVRAFSALNRQFPENLVTFKGFIGLFGQGENTIPLKHVSRFTSMHAGKGTEGLAPRAQVFWDWLQGKGWEDDFASISGLLNRQGIPDTGNSKDPVTKGLEDFFELFGDEENKIPRTHLSRFTSMQHGKGVTGLALRAKAFWGWLQGKGWVDDFASISGLLNLQGIPDTGNSADPFVRELEIFFDLFGEEENKIPRKYLSCFTSMHHAKGAKGLAPRAKAFWGWLQGKGWEDDFASISGLLTLQGIPDTGNNDDPVVKGLENFFDLFGEEDSKIPRKHLSRFTSMHSGKGVVGLTPRAKAFWGWLQGKGWKDDFASVSGLLAKKGIPDNGNSEDPVAKGLENFFDLFGDGESKIPRKYLSRFTSMHCSKGVKGLVPRAQAFWSWLQGKGWEDDFAPISGLLALQGIPDTGNNEDPVVKGLENFFDLFGEEESKIPRKHLSRFTSMCCGKGVVGLTPRAKAFWGWLQGKGWENDFASISGLLNRQGIPDSGNKADPVIRELENFVDLFGDEGNKIPRAHLSRFTSMHSSKGVKELVLRAKAFWGWLQGKGRLDDFASISGLLTKQGIPYTENSTDPVARELEDFFDLFGEKENNIPRTHLSRFTSMHCGKGVKGLAPRTKAFWDWLQGKGWEDDFASISRLLSKQGIPDTGNSADPVAKGLENFFDLFGEGENSIPRKHLSRFTSMYGGKGVPPVNQVLALWTWLDKDSVLLWQAARLFTQEGLPSLPMLNSSLDWLKQVSSWGDDDTMPLNAVPLNTVPLNTVPLNTVPLNTAPLKVMALHLSAPEKKRLARAWVTSFMAHQKGGEKGAPALITLARLLWRHGNDGVKTYQEMVDGDSPLDSYPVIKLLLKAASVDLVGMAVTEIFPQTGFRDASHYLAVCKNIKPAPGLEEWTQVQRYIKTLIRAMTQQNTCSREDEHSGTVHPFNAAWKIQRLYIDALWTLPPTGRQRFLEVRSVQTLLRVVRSITALNQLAGANQNDSFQQQCRACLNTATSVLSSQDLENLFSLHLSLRIPWYQQHAAPAGGFCHASASASSTGVLIRSAPEHGDDGQKLWQPFAAAVVNGLNETAVSRGKKGTFSLVCGEDEWVFDRPHLMFGDQGVTITNWTEEQYRVFGHAIKLPGFEAYDNSVPEPCVTTRQARLVPQPATACTIVHQGLSLQLIERLLKSSVQLRPQTWAQLEHQRMSLPDSILSLLRKMQNWPDMPEDLRLYVQAASREVTDALNPGAMPDLALLKDFDIKGNLVDDLLQPPVLTGETLKLLSPLIDDLTTVQLAEIIAKLDVNMPWDIREPWLKRQAKSHPVSQSNHDNWDLVEWLNADCDTIGTGREPDLDELNNPSIIPDWGESETMDTFWGDLQGLDW